MGIIFETQIRRKQKCIKETFYFRDGKVNIFVLKIIDGIYRVEVLSLKLSKLEKEIKLNLYFCYALE